MPLPGECVDSCDVHRRRRILGSEQHRLDVVLTRARGELLCHATHEPDVIDGEQVDRRQLAQSPAGRGEVASAPASPDRAGSRVM